MMISQHCAAGKNQHFKHLKKKSICRLNALGTEVSVIIEHKGNKSNQYGNTGNCAGDGRHQKQIKTKIQKYLLHKQNEFWMGSNEQWTILL